MPQENGWATGPEHCDNDGRTCPYCGSEDTDSGSLDTQAGQVVESGCECLDCGKTWDQLYNIAGWYHTDEDGNNTLHEDTQTADAGSKAREHVRILREALAKVVAGLQHANEGYSEDNFGDEIRAGLAALEATKET